MSEPMSTRLKALERHLKTEHPEMVRAVDGYRDLDRVAQGMGLLKQDESFAARIPWWPLISVLGTFSAGKSTFINAWLGYQLQRTGNQAVDDKFTVICYSTDGQIHVLPGVALDADPRFPFYEIGAEIEKAAAGEGRRVDAYLQLKTCPSSRLKGRIFIDSPGFDADDQRTAILRVSDHIIDRSDLVLVFFDARRPEPGAMRDTLQHLVKGSISRADSSKFLYILNQVDTAAREDNVEEVVAAWQRALAQVGLTAGRFYRIYTPAAAAPIENDEVRRRYEAKRDEDMAEISRRIEQVETERAYRIIGHMDQIAVDIEEHWLPQLRELLRQWRHRILWLDGVLLGAATLMALLWLLLGGQWAGFSYTPPPAASALAASPFAQGALAVFLALAFGGWHWYARGLARRWLLARLPFVTADERLRTMFRHALAKSTHPLRPLWPGAPAGWNYWARLRLQKVRALAGEMVRHMNDQRASPSGPKP